MLQLFDRVGVRVGEDREVALTTLNAHFRIPGRPPRMGSRGRTHQDNGSGSCDSR